MPRLARTTTALALLLVALPAAAAEPALSEISVVPPLAVIVPQGDLVYAPAPLVIGQRGIVSWSLMHDGTDVSDSLPDLCKGVTFSRLTGAVAGLPAPGCDLTLSYRAHDDGGIDPSAAREAVSQAFPFATYKARVTP